LNAIDALETGLSFYVDARKPLPVASQPTVDQKTVCPSPLECAKLEAYEEMIDQGVK
jgi:antitoxin HicB